MGPPLSSAARSVVLMRSTGSLSARAASRWDGFECFGLLDERCYAWAQVSSGNVFGLQPEVDGTGHSLVLAQIVFKEVRPESLDVW
jgi:hypothetical protein